MSKNELVALSLLSIHPMHTYLLNSVVEEMKLEHWAQVSRASLYTTIRRLEKDGAVSVHLERTENTPERKVFSITEAGRVLLTEELRQGITSCANDGDVLFHLAVNLFFGQTGEQGVQWAKQRIESLQFIKGKINDECRKHIERKWLPPAITLDGVSAHIDVEIAVTKRFIELLTETPDYYERVTAYFQKSISEKQTSSSMKGESL